MKAISKKQKNKLCYDLWAILDRARDYAYVLDDKKTIKSLSILRKKYLDLSGVGVKVCKELSKRLGSEVTIK